MTLTHIPVWPVHDFVIRGKERFTDVIVECHRELDRGSYWQPQDGSSGRVDHCVGVDHDVRHGLHLGRWQHQYVNVHHNILLQFCIHPVTNKFYQKANIPINY